MEIALLAFLVALLLGVFALMLLGKPLMVHITHEHIVHQPPAPTYASETDKEREQRESETRKDIVTAINTFLYDRTDEGGPR